MSPVHLFYRRSTNMRRHLFIVLSIILGLVVLLTLKVQPAAASGPHNPGLPPARTARGRYVCVPSLMWRSPELCPPYGPGTTRYRIASIRLPNPLPELPVLELPHEEEEDVVPYAYAYVKTLPLNIYRHPIEAAMGLPPVRTMLSGDWWVSVDGLVEYEGQRWYQINEEEYVPADALSLAGPSRFQGIFLTEQPQHPLAWINRWVQPSVVPQGALNAAVEPINRYQLVPIFAEEQRGDEIWYLVGPDQWIEQENVSRVDVDPPPPEVGPGEKWIEIDLFEQTVAAYQGERMVYATLIEQPRRRGRGRGLVLHRGRALDDVLPRGLFASRRLLARRLWLHAQPRLRQPGPPRRAVALQLGRSTHSRGPERGLHRREHTEHLGVGTLLATL